MSTNKILDLLLSMITNIKTLICVVFGISYLYTFFCKAYTDYKLKNVSITNYILYQLQNPSIFYKNCKDLSEQEKKTGLFLYSKVRSSSKIDEIPGFSIDKEFAKKVVHLKCINISLIDFFENKSRENLEKLIVCLLDVNKAINVLYEDDILLDSKKYGIYVDEVYINEISKDFKIKVDTYNLHKIEKRCVCLKLIENILNGKNDEDERIKKLCDMSRHDLYDAVKYKDGIDIFSLLTA